jgi:hypothetical protein
MNAMNSPKNEIQVEVATSVPLTMEESSLLRKLLKNAFILAAPKRIKKNNILKIATKVRKTH